MQIKLRRIRCTEKSRRLNYWCACFIVSLPPSNKIVSYVFVRPVYTQDSGWPCVKILQQTAIQPGIEQAFMPHISLY